MGDFFDEEEDPNYSKRERLQNQLFAMQEMLEQLNEAKSTKEDAGDNSQNRGFGPDSSRERWRGGGGRGFAERGGRGRGFAERGGRGGFVERGGRRGTGGRGGRRGRQGRHSPQMSGEIEDADDTTTDREEEYLTSGTGVEDMVEQMKDNEMEFEGDMMDPFEQAIAKREQSSSQDHGASDDATGFERGSPHRHFQSSRGRKMGGCHGSLDTNSDACTTRKSFHQQSWRSSSSKDYCKNDRSQGYHDEKKYFSSGQRYTSSKKPDPLLLVDALSGFPDFRATLLKLMEENDLPPSFVRETVSIHKDIFQVNDEIVELHPKITLCRAHSAVDGCQNHLLCHELHLCPVYVTGWCNNKSCPLGHRWFTEHNKKILKSFFLINLPVQLLQQLFKLLTIVDGPSRKVDICKEYNGNGCSKLECEALHVCHSFVAGRTKCTRSACQLNHDILTPECTLLLGHHGYSTNEAPRDVVIALLAANPSIATSNSSQSDYTLTNKQQSRDRTPSRDKSPEKQKSTKSTKPKIKAGKIYDEPSYDKNKQEKSKTFWSHKLQGDSILAEICNYSVDGRCFNESKGCLRLHASLHYHWQISEQGNNWLNLCSHFVNILENAFNDPNQDGVALPRLDPTKLSPGLKGLLTVMGRETWSANFDAMILTNSDHSKLLCLRRLCSGNNDGKKTNSSLGKQAKLRIGKLVKSISGKQANSSAYEWFFLDIHNQWVKYGKVDTAGETNLVSSVTSDDIETHYLQNPGVPLQFKNASYTYTLDFSAMTQKNENTQVVRQVSRQPKPQI